jgi:hypothetical protein
MTRWPWAVTTDEKTSLIRKQGYADLRGCDEALCKGKTSVPSVRPEAPLSQLHEIVKPVLYLWRGIILRSFKHRLVKCVCSIIWGADLSSEDIRHYEKVSKSRIQSE